MEKSQLCYQTELQREFQASLNYIMKAYLWRWVEKREGEEKEEEDEEKKRKRELGGGKERRGKQFNENIGLRASTILHACQKPLRIYFLDVSSTCK